MVKTSSPRSLNPGTEDPQELKVHRVEDHARLLSGSELKGVELVEFIAVCVCIYNNNTNMCVSIYVFG